MAPPIPPSRRAPLLLAAAVTLALLATIPAAAPAAAQSAPSPVVAAIEQRMAELANQSRAAVGAGPLAVDVNFAAAARAWSCQMAQTNTFAHDPNFAAGGALAEIIAANSGGQEDMGAALHRQFMDSPAHREILLNPGYTRVGIGVCAHNGFWATERFGTGAAVAGPAPTTAPPAPTTAPAPTTVRPAPTSTAGPAPTSTVRPAPPRRRTPVPAGVDRTAVAAARAGSILGAVEGARGAGRQQAQSEALPFAGTSSGLPLLLVAAALLLGGALALRLAHTRYHPTHLRR